jgi:hypothetical protein
MRLGDQKEQQLPVSSTRLGSEQIVESESSHIPGNKAERWIAMTLCSAVLVVGLVQKLIPDRPGHAESFAPGWISLAAAILAVAGIMQLNDRPRWLRVQRALLWGGILLMVWTANGLPFDLLRLTPLMPSGIDLPGMATRTLALAAVVALARLALVRPAASESTRAASWYGYAAFVLAMPYPVLRTCWAFGGAIGLTYPGAAGSGFAPLLIAIPWLLAAALSLLLVSPRPGISRRLLLVAGWSATAIVAMIGPAAFWSMITMIVSGEVQTIKGMATWVPCLFYTSWFLFAIAAGAATRSYQLRTASISGKKYQISK